jgi:hypothetical protein
MHHRNNEIFMDVSAPNKRPRSADTIDLNNEYQVRQWIALFEITLEELTAAVRAYGERAVDVKRYVRARKL